MGEATRCFLCSPVAVCLRSNTPAIRENLRDEISTKVSPYSLGKSDWEIMVVVQLCARQWGCVFWACR